MFPCSHGNINFLSEKERKKEGSCLGIGEGLAVEAFQILRPLRPVSQGM
jgi:hypothetical protein